MPEPFAAHFERTHDFMRLFESGVFSSRVQADQARSGDLRARRRRCSAARPANLLFLDDHLPNIVAAREAGWQAVHFVDAAQAEAEVVASGW